MVCTDLYTETHMAIRQPGAKQASGESGPERADAARSSGQPDVRVEKKNRLAQLVKLVVDTAKARGWDAWVTSRDSKKSRYATIRVARFADMDFGDRVNGLFELTCDDQVRITYSGTSSRSTGLAALDVAITDQLWKLPWVRPRDEKNGQAAKDISDIALLERVLRRFHRTARQLKHRHDNRPPFSILDEYDVQDLLNAILRGLFDDVRSEEYTPSYAGGASRMDFLLKSERIAIETNFASEALKDKLLGEQLIVDIRRYQSHPDCLKLVCFVYDPQGNVKNPAGLEADLSRVDGKLEVKAIVVSP